MHHVFDRARLDALLHEIDTDSVADLVAARDYLQAFDAWIEERSAGDCVPALTLDAFRTEVWFGRGMISLRDGDIDLAVDFFERSIDRCQTTGDTTRRALSLTALALALEYAGLQAQSTRTIFEAVDLAESLHDDRLVARVMLGLCVLYDSQGAYEQLLETAMRTREIAERAGDMTSMLRADNGVGLAFGFLDRADEGIAWIERSVISHEQQLPRLASKLELNLIWLYLRAGRHGEAAALAEEHMDTIAELPGQHAAAIYIDVAEVHVAGGNLSRAAEMLALAEQGLGREPLPSQLLRYYEITANFHEAAGDAEQGLAMLRRHVEIAAEIRGMDANARLVAAERHFAKELAAKTEEIHHLRTVELVEKNDQLTDLIRQKDEILHVVVHDLRNPLAAAQMLSESLLLGAEPEVDAEGLQELRSIRAATSEMGATIDTLLHLQEGGTESVFWPVDEVVARSLAWASKPASDRNIDLRSDIEAVDLKVDGALLRRSMDDVLWMGVQSAAPGDIISLTVRPHGKGARITLSGDRVLFEPEDRTLYIARRLIERMNGSITAEVDATAGSVTVIDLRGT